ncbi:YVTN family beta-propeller protein [Bacillus sp. SLBN-46]|uniref:YncE family protein n=1 Tax=Bacillus sp. SLBN-46 TaxID=3042283 RepID=UPI00285C0EBE|nr:YncE family protein [Bacillus sp. SLBN-46]MDR6121645.1 YVTN family beta-propeller protein [Bacillus sp. SLBN-46]
MKKYLTLLFTSILMLSLFLAGCGNTTNNKKEERNKKTEKMETQSSNNEDHFLFTANEGGSISKISLKKQKILANFKFDGAVHNIQVSPDGKVVGAVIVPKMMHGQDESMEMKGKAIFFDPHTDKIIKEVEVGNHPAHIVFTEDGKYVLVTNNEDNTVSVIDAKNFSIVQTIPTGSGPHGFRISKDSQFAYVANMGENTVSVLNLQSFKEERKIKVGETPVTTGITSDGKTLVVTINKENALAIIDLTSGKIDKVNVGNGPAQVYIQSDNQFAYVANQGTEDLPSHSVTKVDLNTKQEVATIETENGSHGVVTSPDNKYTYITNMFANTVSVIDNSQNKVIRTIKVGETPNGISIMP